jgi:CheY-like chemotaxis protein
LGFCADPVGNGLEAVEALKRVHYPVVLMDCQMPVMDGWEAASLIRRLERQEYWGNEAQGSYLIGLVNGQSDADFEACQKAGMDDCITKPLRKEELKVIMAQAVERVRSGMRVSPAGPKKKAVNFR